MNRIAVLIACAVALTFIATTPAVAVPSSLQSKIDKVLAEFPGGTQISADTVSWHDGETVLTLAGGVASARAVASCATGSFCAWSGTSYTGTKLTLSGCSASGTSNSLAPLGGTPRSLGNSRSSGIVKARNGSTVVYTLAPNVGVTSNSATLTNMFCTT